MGTRSRLTSTFKITSLTPGAISVEPAKVAGCQSGWSSAAHLARYHCALSGCCQRSSFFSVVVSTVLSAGAPDVEAAWGGGQGARGTVLENNLR